VSCCCRQAGIELTVVKAWRPEWSAGALRLELGMAKCRLVLDWMKRFPKQTLWATIKVERLHVQ
jgi:hypothetical protein